MKVIMGTIPRNHPDVTFLKLKSKKITWYPGRRRGPSQLPPVPQLYMERNPRWSEQTKIKMVKGKNIRNQTLFWSRKGLIGKRIKNGDLVMGGVERAGSDNPTSLAEFGARSSAEETLIFLPNTFCLLAQGCLFRQSWVAWWLVSLASHFYLWGWLVIIDLHLTFYVWHLILIFTRSTFDMSLILVMS